MNSKSIGNNGLEKTALTRFRIQKLQVIRYDENDVLKQDSMGFKEKTTVLDKMKWCPVFDDDSQDMLSRITKRIEDL